MTCKDCFHYEICAKYSAIIRNTGEVDLSEYFCKNFKNKNFIIDLSSERS